MEPFESVHIPVLPQEVLQWLTPQPGQIFVDGTLGGGGHTQLLLNSLGSDGMIIGLDRDSQVISRAAQKFANQPVHLFQENFCNLPELLTELQIDSVDGILLDLGISSDQLADRERGFSFDADGPLDLRMDSNQGKPAWQLLQRLSEEHLANLIYEYGEERRSRRIARKLVELRRHQQLTTAKDIAAVIRSCVPASRKHRIDPATRTFQALRIAVNDELKSLEIALRRLPDCLKPGGKLAIISFHSLEDRPVKHAFRNDSRLTVLTKKPIVPGDMESFHNRRSRSAKLRVGQRVEGRQ
ncbi:MAG: 16S rRNA (cytosine(1402)-N(4))-methyltransferase RsmH [Pirellulaceae bacterium]|nr:16S rRNA (cytosine(1402)-N(4))-methyltransferase RsmH [Pirellulaceae bacterium]